MTAREAIFGAIGAAGERAVADEAAIAAAAAGLLARCAPTRPAQGAGTAREIFLRRLRSPALGASVAAVGRAAEVPDAVRRHLAAAGLAPVVALQPHPALRALDWSGFDVRPAIAIDETAAVGWAHGGIAETGSLVFRSGPDSPTLFAFLPLHHIVVVPARRIRPWLEDYATLETGEAWPRNLTLVTGPSGTTDIEGRLVRGAHGPAHLHVLVLDEGG